MAPVDIPRQSRTRAALYALALLGVAWVCYRSAVEYPFIQDDYHHMWQSRIRGWASLPHILTVQLPFYRPVSNAWYFALGELAWGLDPRPYHVINILTYVGSAWCVCLLGTRLFASRAAGQAAGLVFLTTCGHLLPIYWICVMTTGALVFFFLVAWACDRLAWETGRTHWRVLASLAFGACVFSNITGFTLAPILTVSARVLAPRPSWRVLARAHWPLYAWAALWVVLQFLVLGWPTLPNYALGAGTGGVAEKFLLLTHFIIYSMSPLYLLALRSGLAGAPALGLLSLCLAAVVAFGAWRYRAEARRVPAGAAGGLGLVLALGLVAWGLAPYVPLQRHFAPYHVGIASIGVSLALGWLFGRAVPRGATVMLLGGWLCVSLVAIRAYEEREHTTHGIGWKGTLARNVVADVGGILAMRPDARRLVIVNHNEHLTWFFEYGRVPDLYYGRPDLEIVDGGDGRGVRPAPGQVVVRYRDMHLELLPD